MEPMNKRIVYENNGTPNKQTNKQNRNNGKQWRMMIRPVRTVCDNETARHKLGTEHIKLSTIWALKLCWAHLVGGLFNVMSISIYENGEWNGVSFTIILSPPSLFLIKIHSWLFSFINIFLLIYWTFEVTFHFSKCQFVRQFMHLFVCVMVVNVVTKAMCQKWKILNSLR